MPNANPPARRNQPPSRRGKPTAGAAGAKKPKEESSEEKEKSLWQKIIEGGLLTIALIVLAAIAIIVIIIFAIISLIPEGFLGRPSITDDLASGGCYVADAAFSQVQSATADETMARLSRYNNLKGKKTQVQKIIDASRAAGINYYLLMDIWAGEQTFGADEKAFGCGVYDGQNRYPGFDSQLSCAVDKIKKAINNQEPYNKPAGADTFTRLFYTYTGGMRQHYDQYGYVAGADNPRIVIHKILAPDQVVCTESGELGPGVAYTGDKLYPPLGPIMPKGTTYGGHSTWESGHCTSCAVDYGRPIGTPVYAALDGTVYGLKLQGVTKGYYFRFRSSNGQVKMVYAHIMPMGKLSIGDIGKEVQVIKGDKVGALYPHYNGAHLHLEMIINGSVIGIRNGHNYQWDYMAKVQ